MAEKATKKTAAPKAETKKNNEVAPVKAETVTKPIKEEKKDGTGSIRYDRNKRSGCCY